MLVLIPTGSLVDHKIFVRIFFVTYAIQVTQSLKDNFGRIVFSSLTTGDKNDEYIYC